MRLISEQSRRALESFPNSESLTVVAASGISIEHAAAALHVDLNAPRDADSWETDETAWALRAVSGGVVAVESSGFGDPTTSALRRLSGDGQSSAVVRSNILAHVRFGCARNGQLRFDDDEFRYHIDDPSEVPDELHPLIRMADLEDWLLVGLAMVEKFTGLGLSPADVVGLYDSTFYAAPSGVYWGQSDEPGE